MPRAILGRMSLVVDRLTKRFGSVVALDALSFEVPRGQVFGFLGANGAGKTTTMRIALGVLRPDEGSIAWDGVRSDDLPRTTWGYLPEERGLYPRMTILDQLVYFAGLYGVPADVAAREVRHWLARFRVPEFADRRAEELSKGNQQKVQFLAAILHDPDVLLMDEPFTGLDPVNVSLLREAFLELRDRGKTIIFSTHQMETAEAMCESVAIVDRGRVVVQGSIAELAADGKQTILVATSDNEEARRILGEHQAIHSLSPENGHFRITLHPDVEAVAAAGDISRRLVLGGAAIQRFEPSRVSLEQRFLEITTRLEEAA